MATRSTASSKATIAIRRRVAQNARVARERLGLTQERAAERIGCSTQAYQRFERAVSRVSLDFVAAVARAYRLDPGDLFVAATWQPPRVGRPTEVARQERRSATTERAR